MCAYVVRVCVLCVVFCVVVFVWCVCECSVYMCVWCFVWCVCVVVFVICLCVVCVYASFHCHTYIYNNLIQEFLCRVFLWIATSCNKVPSTS